MTAVSIKKNDQVMVQAGRDRGKTGKVLKVFRERGRAIVENINKIKRHTKANPSRNVKGGIMEREASMAISNLMPICPDCQKPTRVGRKLLEDGKKIRICKHCQGSLDRG